MQPAGLHETRLFAFSVETSGFKIDSFNPKCNQHWRSQFLSEWFHATKLVAFRIEGVNFDTASCATVTQLFFLADGGSLVIFFENAWSWTPDLPISWKVFKVSILGGGLYPLSLSPMSSPAPPSPLQTCRGHKKFVLNAFLSEAVYVRREGKDLQDPKDFLLKAGQV